MNAATIAVAVSIAVFVLGVVYAAGRFSMRIEHLEDWRAEVREDFKEMGAGIRRLEGLIKGEDV